MSHIASIPDWSVVPTEFTSISLSFFSLSLSSLLPAFAWAFLDVSALIIPSALPFFLSVSLSRPSLSLLPSIFCRRYHIQWLVEAMKDKEKCLSGEKTRLPRTLSL